MQTTYYIICSHWSQAVLTYPSD